jgi:hypothetical protein
MHIRALIRLMLAPGVLAGLAPVEQAERPDPEQAAVTQVS